MTLVQLEYVVALHTFKHFAKAAEHCHVTQPSLSMQLQKLEEELGVPIFIRTNPVTPTETGKVVIEQAKKILAEASAMQQLVHHEKNIMAGTLKIGIISTLAPYLLPQFLQLFIKKYPQVHLSIHELTTENITRQLKNGSLDAGILATPLDIAGMKEEFLFNEEFVAYVSPREKLSKKKMVSPGDIDVNDCWLLEEGHCLRNQVMNLCAMQKNASKEKHFDYAAGSIETLKQFVDKNGGLTLLPELATFDLSNSKKDRLRYFRGPVPAREISMVTLKTFSKKKLVEVLKQTIVESLPLQVKRKRNVEVIGVEV